jgi:alanine-glyoxylate transaminase/serine-glyoxylate transaminase/serine-pyruvate transaminase
MKKYEARQPSYFATPPVQLILALEVSLNQFMRNGMEHRFDAHVKASDKIKSACARLGLKLVLHIISEI